MRWIVARLHDQRSATLTPVDEAVYTELPFLGGFDSPERSAAAQFKEQVLESLKESCGVFGVYAPGEDVSRITFFGIYALQHRGQESAGIATGDGSRLHLHTRMGLVNQAFEEHDLERLTGHLAIGHTRYSTTGSSRAHNAQPLLVKGPWGPLALAHNGNVVNALELRRGLEKEGIVFQTATDSEVIAWLIATAPGHDWQERVRYAMGRLRGAYSLDHRHPGCLDRLPRPAWACGLCASGGTRMAGSSHPRRAPSTTWAPS